MMNTETIETITALAEASKSFDWAKQTGPAQNELIRAIHLVVVHGKELERRQRLDSPTRFVVKGRGVFPADMLRHDHCWPVDGDINRVTDPTVKLGDRKDVTVTLCAQARRCITPARWASFGWVVTEIDGETEF
jgi:hypothetical protein